MDYFYSLTNICLFKEEDREYTSCNLKTMELLNCALLGVCAVIRSNTVFLLLFSCIINTSYTMSTSLSFSKKHAVLSVRSIT